ncbi:hypothetical protein MPH_05930 [Macrophomina phaseolina MS6]|uniref:Uncharacterized protein n=1 Tax=Macrophomina phaseolina (strain MS6) TaxID=1126212 RepID=K2RPZ4_MACPH|nr:hypothetical protein MPH_05930 [Macrophomina phaseolina MS6]
MKTHFAFFGLRLGGQAGIRPGQNAGKKDGWDESCIFLPWLNGMYDSQGRVWVCEFINEGREEPWCCCKADLRSTGLRSKTPPPALFPWEMWTREAYRDPELMWAF